jgi:hypothetical protein
MSHLHLVSRYSPLSIHDGSGNRDLLWLSCVLLILQLDFTILEPDVGITYHCLVLLIFHVPLQSGAFVEE